MDNNPYGSIRGKYAWLVSRLQLSISCIEAVRTGNAVLIGSHIPLACLKGPRIEVAICHVVYDFFQEHQDVSIITNEGAGIDGEGCYSSVLTKSSSQIWDLVHSAGLLGERSCGRSIIYALACLSHYLDAIMHVVEQVQIASSFPGITKLLQDICGSLKISLILLS